ncbi:MAG TPA: TolC family protein, partial [Pirellula sp.]|nr:TolC family protein [Pirellula sp.]
KEYYPDFELMTRYDAFWTDRVQRGQLGMNMNIPIQNDRRAAAVREAQFRVQRMCSELAAQQDAVNEEVQMAFARVEASRKTVMLFRDRILAIAEVNLETARAAYIAGSIDFLRLMDAKRQTTEQQIGYQRALTEYHRSVAELQRSIGN